MVLRNKYLALVLFLLDTSVGVSFFGNTNLTYLYPEKISQWRFFSCFSSKVNYIKVVQIYENSELLSDLYMNEVLKDIYENLQLTIYVQKFNLTYEEEFYKYSELFPIHGEKFELRQSQRTDSKMIEDSLNNSWTTGRSEHNFGVIVIVDTIDVLLEYARGSARPPFKTPHAFYVVVILENVVTYFESFEILLETLWRNYEIFKIILITADSKMKFFTYNPFVEKSNDVDQNSTNIYDNWGAIEENLIDNRTVCSKLLDIPKSFNGYPIGGAMFRIIPLSIRWDEFSPSFQKNHLCDVRKYSTEFGGFDGILYGNLIKELNITPKITKLDQWNGYGYKNKNGTFGGTFGELLYGISEMAVNPHFLMQTPSREIEYLHPVTFDKFCIVIAKANIIPDGLVIFKCYNSLTWMAIILMNFILGVIWKIFRSWGLFVLSRKESEMKKNFNRSGGSVWQSMIIDMWLIMTSGATLLTTFSFSEKIFLTTCLVFSLITNGIFQGSVMTSFSTILYYKDITTLKELDASGMTVLANSQSISEMIFGNSDDDTESDVISSLRNKTKIASYFIPLSEISIYRNASILYQYNDFHIMREYHLSPSGADLLYLIPECPRTFHNGYVVRKGWPLRDRVNEIFANLLSGGILQYWYEAASHAIILEKKFLRIKAGYLYYARRPYKIGDAAFAFVLLAAGYLFSLLILILEVLWKKYYKN